MTNQGKRLQKGYNKNETFTVFNINFSFNSIIEFSNLLKLKEKNVKFILTHIYEYKIMILFGCESYFLYFQPRQIFYSSICLAKE